jgi:hypothetical protein
LARTWFHAYACDRPGTPMKKAVPGLVTMFATLEPVFAPRFRFA